MPEERICASCGRANPIDQPRCINCGQRAQGVVMVAEKSAATSAWWTGSTTHQGTIPPPPQVREEVQRAETIRLDEERRKVERERRAAEARERQARQVAQRQAAATATTAPAAVSRAISVDCLRCGTPLEATASGEGFSFCLLCGAEAPAVQRVEAPTKEAFGTDVYGGNVVGTNNIVGTATVIQSEVVAGSRKSNRSPLMSAVFSFLLPGIGQCVNGQAAKGALLLLVYFLSSTVFSLAPLGILMLIVRGVAAADAFRIADKRRKGLAVRDGEWDLG